MKLKFFLALALVSGFLLASVPLFAHHGNTAFDMAKKVTLTGTVTEFYWANPHCLIKFDVMDKGGQLAHWTGETSNPADLVNSGWSKQTLKPGDPVTVTLNPVKNGQTIGRILDVVIPGGQKMRGWPSLPELNEK